MSGFKGSLEKATWNRALKDEVKLTKTRRQREQHGQKPVWWKRQSQMSHTFKHKDKPQSRNKKRDWRVAGVRSGKALEAVVRKCVCIQKAVKSHKRRIAQSLLDTRYTFSG